MIGGGCIIILIIILMLISIFFFIDFFGNKIEALIGLLIVILFFSMFCLFLPFGRETIVITKPTEIWKNSTTVFAKYNAGKEKNIIINSDSYVYYVADTNNLYIKLTNRYNAINKITFVVCDFIITNLPKEFITKMGSDLLVK